MRLQNQVLTDASTLCWKHSFQPAGKNVLNDLGRTQIESQI